MASIDLSPVPLEMRDMFLLMSSAHVMGLSYHRWLHLVAALFFVLCALNAGIQLEPISAGS